MNPTNSSILVKGIKNHCVEDIMTMEAIGSAFKIADTIKELNFDPQPYGFRKGVSYVKNENAPLHKDLKL